MVKEASQTPACCAEHILQIDLDLDLGGDALHLKDSFEWDLTNPDNSPDEFATVLVADHIHSLTSKAHPIANYAVGTMTSS